MKSFTTKAADTIKSHPIIFFFILTYAISWAIWIPLVVYYQHNPVETKPLPFSFLLPALIGGFGPTFAALIMVGIRDGRVGVKKMMSRWLIWRVGIGWYVTIPLLTIGIRLGGIALYVMLGGVKPELNLALWYVFFLDFAVSIIGGPICEETGWRGYALPMMQKRFGALISGLIIGVFWTLWHVPGFFVPGMALPAIPLNWLLILNFLLRVMSLSVLFTWLFNNTKGSLFIAFLFHAAVNSSATTLFKIFNFGEVADSIMGVLWFNTALQWLVVAIIAAVYGSSHLSRKQKFGVTFDAEKSGGSERDS